MIQVRNTLVTPPHTRQKYEQISGPNTTPNASKQGKFGSWGPYVCSYFGLYVGVGAQKESPFKSEVVLVLQGFLIMSSGWSMRTKKKGERPLAVLGAAQFWKCSGRENQDHGKGGLSLRGVAVMTLVA